jgi:hypothetical protein
VKRNADQPLQVDKPHCSLDSETSSRFPSGHSGFAALFCLCRLTASYGILRVSKHAQANLARNASSVSRSHLLLTDLEPHQKGWTGPFRFNSPNDLRLHITVHLVHVDQLEADESFGRSVWKAMKPLLNALSMNSCKDCLNPKGSPTLSFVGPGSPHSSLMILLLNE